MKYNLHFRGKTTEKQEKLNAVHKQEVLDKISELMEEKEIIKLKIIKVKE